MWKAFELQQLLHLGFTLHKAYPAKLQARPGERRYCYHYLLLDHAGETIGRLFFTEVNGIIHDYKVNIEVPKVQYMGVSETFMQFLAHLATRGFVPATALYRRLVLDELIPTL